MATEHTMLEAALSYADRRLPVFPCKAVIMPDRSVKKKPLVAGGFKAATTDPAQIEDWWKKNPDAMIGMPTGEITDLHLLDVDVHSHDGFKTLKKLGLSLDDVPKVVTPSGGNHFYHRLGGHPLRNTAGRLGPGVDTRANGGYAILPPSWHDPNKPPYEFVNGSDLLAAPLIPDELVRLLIVTAKRTAEQQLEDECARLEAAPEGTRNDLLFRSAVRLAKLAGKKDGLTEPGIREALTKAALKAGLSLDEIESTLNSAFNTEKRDRRARKEDDSGKQGRPLELPEPTPWEEEVNGAQLLNGLAEDLKAYLVVTPEQADAAALWVLHSHVYEASMVTPRLAITSPVGNCGKTTLLDWIARGVTRPLEAGNISTSATFRTIELAKPTLLIDEADTFLRGNDELRGVLNSGHRRGGSVIRTVGEDHEPRQFATHCPTAIALIGRLPATLQTRSIELELKRKLPHEKVQSLSSARHEEHVLARQAARWAQDNRAALATAEPELPEQLVNRTADNWRPLFAIAEAAGGNWPARAKAAALRLNAIEDVRTLGLEALSDIRDVFLAKNAPSLSTADLILELICDPEKAWQDFKFGKCVSARQLAGLLKPFGIKSRDIHPNDRTETVKGYRLSDLQGAFDRYLPPLKGGSDEEESA